MAERLYSFKFYLLSVLSIIFIVLLFFFLLNAKFFLSDELTIIITPGAGRIFLETGEQKTVTLSVKNDNFRVCKTSCVLSTIFPEGSKTESSHHLSHGETIYHDIPIETPSYGHGHLFYTVVARCRNIESFFCATDGTERMNSAIIQATYSLSTTDETLKAQTKESIEHLIGLFEAQEDAYSQLIALGPAIPPDLAIPIVPEKELLEKIALWSEERYSQIDQENIHSLAQQLEKTISDISKAVEKGIRDIESWNASVAILSSIDQEQLSDMQSWYETHQTITHIQSLTTANELSSEILSLMIFSRTNETQLNRTTAHLKSQIKDYASNKELHDHLTHIGRTYLDKKNVTSNTTICSGLLEELITENDKAKAERASSQTIGDASNDSLLLEIGALLSQGIDHNRSDLIPLATLDLSQFTDYHNRSCGEPKFDFNLSFLSALISLDITSYKPMGISIPPFNQNNNSLKDPSPHCCGLGSCGNCTRNPAIPILFIHGHAFTAGTPPEYSSSVFIPLQQHLEGEGYGNAGHYTSAYDDLDFTGIPLTFRASYYYISHYSIAGYGFSVQKEERIENYALRLSEIINGIRRISGSDKVIVVGYSMGGLVAREYLSLFGDEKVERLITINSPHQGIEGTVQRLCPIFGTDKECEDMERGSVFLTRLTAQDIHQKTAAVYTVGCIMDGGRQGDGVVIAENALLPGAEHYQINGSCTTFLHQETLHPDLYKETADILLRLIRE